VRGKELGVRRQNQVKTEVKVKKKNGSPPQAGPLASASRLRRPGRIGSNIINRSLPDLKKLSFSGADRGIQFLISSSFNALMMCLLKTPSSPRR
jgi:hypothetical protein